MCPPKEFILKILLKNLPSASSKLPYSEEYFNLIASIIRACGDIFVIDQTHHRSEGKIERPGEVTAS